MIVWLNGTFGCGVIFSAIYLLTCRLLGCLMVLARHEVSKDGELLVLRHENAVLRRQIGRVRYQPVLHKARRVHGLQASDQQRQRARHPARRVAEALSYALSATSYHRLRTPGGTA